MWFRLFADNCHESICCRSALELEASRANDTVMKEMTEQYGDESSSVLSESEKKIGNEEQNSGESHSHINGSDDSGKEWSSKTKLSLNTDILEEKIPILHHASVSIF